MLSKTIIRDNFSKNAKCYDQYSSIQDECANELIGCIGDISPQRIVDVGCGTGNFTELLLNKFPYAHIAGVDISKDMIEQARRKLGGKSELIVG
ncbi:MAG: methyltransferase domain-containing protein, partial [Candidatus Omnitrophota bacterium]